MAYSPADKYPTAVDSDPNYKGGKFRDNSPSTTNNGSPLKAIDRNESLARDEAIMNEAGFDYNGLPDTPQDSQLFKAYKASLGNGANLLSNHNFLIQSPDDSQPAPSSTPTSYPPGYQVFSGVFANETTGITNLTYIDGRVSFSGGDLYFAVPNTGAIARLTAAQLTASVADFDGKPRGRGVSFALVGDEYRVTVGIDALEDVAANPTPLGSVKFEQGSVATRHDVGALSTGNFSDYTDVLIKNDTSKSAVDKMVANFSTNPLAYALGTIFKTGGTTWEYIDSTGTITLDNFRAFNCINVFDFGVKGERAAGDIAKMQKAVDYIKNIAGTNPRDPRASSKLYIPAGQYLVDSILLLYQKDGIKIVGDGEFETQFILGDLSGFTYPSEWQALPDFADYQANPAVIQVAQRRVTGVGNPGSGGSNLDNTGYSQSGAGAAAWYYTFEGIGFYGRDTAFKKQIHGIYGKEIAQLKIDGIYAEGIKTTLDFRTYTSSISNVRSFDCFKPANIEGGTSLTMSTCGSAWCDEGYTLHAIYSTFISLACDHWGVGSFAYDVGAIGQSFIGCGSENGFGGILRVNGEITGQQERYGVKFDSCILQGGVVEGAINDTGQTSVSDFGVLGMIEIRSANVVFDNCAFLSEILRGGNTTYLGARLVDHCDIVIGQSGDRAVRQTRTPIIFDEYVTVELLTTGFPSVKFTSDYDRDYGGYYNTTDIVFTGDGSTEFTMDSKTNPEQDQYGRYNGTRYVGKTGGRVQHTLSGVVEGTGLSYVLIQRLPADGSPAQGVTRPLANNGVGDEQKSFYLSETFQMEPSDEIRYLIRHTSSGRVLANAVLTWEQI